MRDLEELRHVIDLALDRHTVAPPQRQVHDREISRVATNRVKDRGGPQVGQGHGKDELLERDERDQSGQDPPAVRPEQGSAAEHGRAVFSLLEAVLVAAAKGI